MTLTFGKTSPQDMLEKAERDLARLEASESAQDPTAASDAIFDLAVSVTSLKDWLKEHLPAPASKQVEPYVAASLALSSFRDIANGGKHSLIRFYTPSTNDVAASVTVVIDSALTAEHLTHRPQPESPRWRLKIIRADQSRHHAVELGHRAIQEWRTFMSLHGVTPDEA